MRLHVFRRRAHAPETDPGIGEQPSVARPREGWAELGALRPVGAGLELTGDGRAFQRGLATLARPVMSLSRLARLGSSATTLRNIALLLDTDVVKHPAADGGLEPVDEGDLGEFLREIAPDGALDTARLAGTVLPRRPPARPVVGSTLHATARTAHAAPTAAAMPTPTATPAPTANVRPTTTLAPTATSRPTAMPAPRGAAASIGRTAAQAAAFGTSAPASQRSQHITPASEAGVRRLAAVSATIAPAGRLTSARSVPLKPRQTSGVRRAEVTGAAALRHEPFGHRVARGRVDEVTAKRATSKTAETQLPTAVLPPMRNGALRLADDDAGTLEMRRPAPHVHEVRAYRPADAPHTETAESVRQSTTGIATPPPTTAPIADTAPPRTSPRVDKTRAADAATARAPAAERPRPTRQPAVAQHVDAMDASSVPPLLRLTPSPVDLHATEAPPAHPRSRAVPPAHPRSRAVSPPVERDKEAEPLQRALDPHTTPVPEAQTAAFGAVSAVPAVQPTAAPAAARRLGPALRHLPATATQRPPRAPGSRAAQVEGSPAPLDESVVPRAPLEAPAAPSSPLERGVGPRLDPEASVAPVREGDAAVRLIAGEAGASAAHVRPPQQTQRGRGLVDRASSRLMPALRRVAASHRNHSADAATSAADRAAEKIPATLRSGPVSTQAADTPPSSVVSAVSRIVAQDLSDVAVWRDEESGNAAAQLDARAFTADGEIHMPPGHGSANDRRATALLAHELTHVAQQRRTAFGVPSEGSPQGRRLEAEALAVERSVMRHGVTMTRPRPAATTPVTGARDHRAAATASRVRPGVQRAEDNVTAVGGVNDEAGDRGFEHVDLDELARRLYGRLRRELRDELLLDRERAGLAVERW